MFSPRATTADAARQPHAWLMMFSLFHFFFRRCFASMVAADDMPCFLFCCFFIHFYAADAASRFRLSLYLRDWFRRFRCHCFRFRHFFFFRFCHDCCFRLFDALAACYAFDYAQAHIYYFSFFFHWCRHFDAIIFDYWFFFSQFFIDFSSLFCWCFFSAFAMLFFFFLLLLLFSFIAVYAFWLLISAVFLWCFLIMFATFRAFLRFRWCHVYMIFASASFIAIRLLLRLRRFWCWCRYFVTARDIYSRFSCATQRVATEPHADERDAMMPRLAYIECHFTRCFREPRCRAIASLLCHFACHLLLFIFSLFDYFLPRWWLDYLILPLAIILPAICWFSPYAASCCFSTFLFLRCRHHYAYDAALLIMLRFLYYAVISCRCHFVIFERLLRWLRLLLLSSSFLLFHMLLFIFAFSSLRYFRAIMLLMLILLRRLIDKFSSTKIAFFSLLMFSPFSDISSFRRWYYRLSLMPRFRWYYAFSCDVSLFSPLL